MRLPDRPSGPWPRRHAAYFDLLSQFVRREGHARVVDSHRHGRFLLGLWVSKRRSAYRKGLLTPEQIRSLEKLPGWTWSPRHDAFQRGLAVLKAFVKRVGHARVPQSHIEQGFHLGDWICSRRNDHRDGRLRRDRARALQALPGWSWRPRDDDFQEGLRMVKAFARRVGHAAVPHDHRVGPFRLGYWVAVKRLQYLKGRLAPERIRALEALPGWSWQRMEDRFQNGLEHLRRYVKREGHARVPVQHSEGSFRLGIWLNGIRRAHRQKKLPRAWAKTLEGLPGWTWRPLEASFERGLGYLKAYVRRTGHALVPRDHVERGFRLGGWVNARRAQYKQHTLPKDRIRTLQRLPGWKWKAARPRSGT